MWTVRSHEQRGTAQFDWLDSKHTFSFGHYWDPKHMGFGVLRVINEDRIQPGAGFPKHPHRDMEILSYVLEGALEHKDSMGTGSVIRPGELQYMSAGSGVTHSEYNGAPGAVTHFYQIWIVPSELGGPPRYAQIRIDDEGRLDKWLLIAGAPRFGAPIDIRQDAALHCTKLTPGKSVAVAAAADRQYWLQVARGRVQVSRASSPGVTTALVAGDGLGVRISEPFHVEAVASSEVLLFDLPLG